MSLIHFGKLTGPSLYNKKWENGEAQALAPAQRISDSDMHASVQPLVLSFGRSTDAVPYGALEGTQRDEYLVLAHKDLPLITEEANYKINGQLIKLLDSERNLVTEIQEVQ